MNSPEPDITRIERLMMAVMDNEATPAEVEDLNRLLKEDTGLALEYRELLTLKKAAMTAQLKQPDPNLWDNYWLNTWTRMERRIGWILFSVGAVILLLFGAWELTREWITDPGLPLWVKIAGILLGTGTIILLVSVIREKLFLHKNERYKDIKR
jgi:hypothetical protein